MTAPTPSLKYLLWSQGGEGIVGSEGPPLANVSEVSAWEQHGQVVVWARGQMRRKDGTASRVSRCLRVLTAHRQPAWLDEIVEDAIARLLSAPPAAQTDSSASEQGEPT